jgi:hypothetical protein
VYVSSVPCRPRPVSVNQRLCSPLRRFMIMLRGDLREASEGMIRRWLNCAEAKFDQRGFGIHGFIRKGEEGFQFVIFSIFGTMDTPSPSLLPSFRADR